jgi:hypothetical protein
MSKEIILYIKTISKSQPAVVFQDMVENPVEVADQGYLTMAAGHRGPRYRNLKLPAGPLPGIVLHRRLLPPFSLAFLQTVKNDDSLCRIVAKRRYPASLLYVSYQ